MQAKPSEAKQSQVKPSEAKKAKARIIDRDGYKEIARSENVVSVNLCLLSYSGLSLADASAGEPWAEMAPSFGKECRRTLG